MRRIDVARLVVGLTLAFGIAGCGKTPVAGKPSAAPVETTAVSYLVKEEPAGALGVADARQSKEAVEEITVVGRIGGSGKPFVEGAAAFTIVDPSVPHCSDEEGCPTPWDYCCQTDVLPTSTALIKVVDPQGQLVAEDARKLLGVKELAMVVVHGKAERDEKGNLTVLADQVFVKEMK
jgi:hypothetical protein